MNLSQFSPHVNPEIRLLKMYLTSKEHSSNSVKIIQVKVFNFLHKLMSILYPSYDFFVFNLKIPGGCINSPVFLNLKYNSNIYWTVFLVVLY